MAGLCAPLRERRQHRRGAGPARCRNATRSRRAACAQRFSSSASIWLSVLAGSATRACISDPSAERTSRPSVPPWRSSSQRSGQSVSICSVDGDSVTTWSSPDHSGCVGGQRRRAVPLRRVGAGHACLLPAAPIALRHRHALSSSTAPVGAQTTARSRPTSAAGASTRGAWIGLGVDSASGSVASAASSSQNGDGSIASSPLSLSTAVTSSVRAGPAHRRDRAACAPRPAAAPWWTPRASPITPSSTSTSCWVPSTPPRGMVLGHNPSCSPAMTTNSHSRPERGVRAQHRDRVAVGRGRRGVAGEGPVRDVVDETAQRRTGGAGDVLLGDVEQRGDGVEVAVGLRAGGAAALAGRQPAPLQAGAVPGLPQRVARIPPVGRAAARGGQHRAHPPQRRASVGGESGGHRCRAPRPAGRRTRAAAGCRRAGAAPDATAAATPGRPGRSARSAATAPASPSSPSAVASSTVSSACTAGCSASGAPAGGRSTGTPGRGQRARQRRPSPRHRPHDDRHLRPRHAVDRDARGAARRRSAPIRRAARRRSAPPPNPAARRRRRVARPRRRRAAAARCR